MFNVPNVTERKSAPLPERSFERITCCAILNVAYAGNCSAIGTQSECADHRRHCTPERQNISLKNGMAPGGQKAKNPAGGSEEGIFSGFKVMIKKSCSGMKEKGRLSPASGDYAAASSELNSMCIRSYGRMILFSSRLSTPPESKACISLYTPRKSRLTVRDSSRIDIAGFPSIALIICQRLGVSIVLASCSTVGNIRLAPMKSPFIARAASDAARRKAASTGITFTVITRIVLPPQLVNIRPETGYQIFYGSEGYRVFPVTNMLMVSLSPFVVVTHNAHFIDDISEAVFVPMHTAFYGRCNLQNTDCRKGIISNLNPCVHQLNSGHRFPLLVDVNNNINKEVMKAITSKKDDSELPGSGETWGFITAPLLVDYSCSLGFRRCSDFNFRSQASSTHAEKLEPGFPSFSSSMLASTFSIMPCGKRIPLYVVLLFIWFFVIPYPIYCLNKNKDTPVNHGVKLFKQISLTCLNTLLSLFKQFEVVKLVKTAKPRSAATLTRLLTTSDRKSIEAAMRNYTTWREKETGSNCPLQLADKNRLQQSVCCIYVECRNPAMTDAGSIYDVYQPMARCVLFRSVSGRTLQSERAHCATSNGAVCTSFDVAGSQSLFLLRRTLRRQSMVSPVGEYLYSPVKPFSGIPDPASSATSQTVKKSLRTGNGVGYVNYAPHKTGAGRGNPKLSKATQDAESVFFVVRHMCHSMVWCVIRPRSYNRRYIALLAYHTAHDGAMCSYRCAWWTFTTHAPMSTPRRPVMVALAGLPQGRPVPFDAGISTPVNVTALFERGNSGGDSLNQSKEDAAMATTPDLSHPDSVKKSLPVSRFGRYIPAAGVNPPAGFSSLNDKAGSRNISDMRYFYARNTTRTRIMAGRDGGAFALAGSFIASLLTLSRLATPFSSVVARLLNSDKGASVMAVSARLQGRISSHLNATHKPLFIWLFAAVSRADLTDHTPHMVRITAPDELTARRSLVGRYVLSFAGRIPAQEVHHA